MIFILVDTSIFLWDREKGYIFKTQIKSNVWLLITGTATRATFIDIPDVLMPVSQKTRLTSCVSMHLQWHKGLRTTGPCSLLLSWLLFPGCSLHTCKINLSIISHNTSNKASDFMRSHLLCEHIRPSVEVALCQHQQSHPQANISFLNLPCVNLHLETRGFFSLLPLWLVALMF